jgi:hypothetical protein
MFQVLDEMNLDDVSNGTKLIRISNTFIEGVRVKQGAKITMGIDIECLLDILSDKATCVLVVVEKPEYFKRKKAITQPEAQP